MTAKHKPLGLRLDVSLLMQGGVIAELHRTRKHHYLEVFFNDISMPERNRSLFIVPNAVDKIVVDISSTRIVVPDRIGCNVYHSRNDSFGGQIETVEALGADASHTVGVIEQCMEIFLSHYSTVCPQPLRIDVNLALVAE